MRVNLMTACLAAGDAIGNYIDMLRTALAPRHEVAVFADLGTREKAFLPSYAYVARPGDVLWFHYSIHAENFAQLRGRGPDFKIMDFHGVCPPELYADDEPEQKRLAARAIEALPRYRDVFDLCLVHSDYSAGVLRAAGYERIVKTPLAIGRALAGAEENPFLAEQLPRLEYFLFVGRVVAQKDILGLIELFGSVRRRRPNLKLWIIGGRQASSRYQSQIDGLIQRLGLERQIGFTGRVTDPTFLKPFFKYARLFVALSKWETFCVPVVEAMGFGVPTATCEKTCLPEILGGTGLLFGRDSLEVAAEQIAALLEDEPRYGELRRKCLERAPRFAEERLAEAVREVERDHFPPRGKP